MRPVGRGVGSCLAVVVVAATVLLSACGGAATPASTAAGAAARTTTTADTPSAQPTGASTTGGGNAPAVAIPVAGTPPVTGTPWYLAVGDSITSGFTIDPSRAGTNSAWALQLQPLLAGRGQRWTLFDTACAGERIDTYYTRCPGRRAIPFLASQSQHDAALAAIHAHLADLRLILVDLGSNDLLQALEHGAAPATATATLHDALDRLVAELRAAAPAVPIVIATYYDPLANLVHATLAELVGVNDMVRRVAADHRALVADFFAAVNTSTAATDPHLCDYVDCAHGDIHPTVLGHTRLAEAALAAIPAT